MRWLLQLLFGFTYRNRSPRYRTKRKVKVREPRLTGKAWVLDADDIVVQRVRVRLYGLDAPEHRQLAKRNGKWYNQGQWVKSQLINAIGGRRVVVNVQTYDKYGRAIGIVKCDDKDVCEWMVKEGLAISAYSDKYQKQQRYARKKKLGIWGDEISYDPRHYKHGKRIKLY